MGLFQQLLSSDFTPHGFCYLWDPRIVWLHVISDGLITLSYYCIPVILIYFIRKNRHLPFNKIFWMFGTFILACGTTHLMEIWNIWHASYLLAGVIKALTAAVSVLTAAMLIPLIPKVISLPERAHLQEVNRSLEREIAERKHFDMPIDAPLRRRITGGFIVALLLTVSTGVSGWRGAQQAAQDDYWVSHTHEVMETIQRLSRHAIEAATSAQAFALTGQEPLLLRCQTARDSVLQDKDALRHLTSDNLSQQRRLHVLEPQVSNALEFAQRIIAKHRKVQADPGASDALEIERLMDGVRATTRDMYAEETRLLRQRSERAEAGQRLSKVIAIAGAFLGTCLWVLARFAVNREIDVSARARTQVATLNAVLERRVEERTAALQLEITERKRAEEAWRESEERFQAMANGIPQLAWMAEADGHIFWYNRRWYEYTGTTFEQMEGWAWQSVHDPEMLPKVLARWNEAIANGTPLDMEFPLRRADGNFGRFLTRVVPLKDSNGTVLRWFGTNTDITALKQVEEALHEQSRALDLAQVLVRDMNSRIVLWNLGAERLYGFTREEALGRVSHELLRTEFPEALEGIEEQLERDGKWEGELVHHKRHGERIVVSSLWVLHRDAQGQSARILEANVDITARKAAEERLVGQAGELARQAEELKHSRQALEAKTLMLQSVLDSMAEGLIAADGEGRFLIWNDAAKKLMGRDAADLPTELWTPYYQVFLPDGITPYPPNQLPLVRALRGESVKVELVVQHPETFEERFMEVATRPMRDAQGILCGGVAVLHDITQRKEAEREIQKLNDELEHRVVERTAQLEAANRELEAFSYSVSHDLRAPLRHIGGFSKMLVEEFGPTLEPGAQHYLDRIQAGTQKMGQLVDELLNLAKVGRHALNHQPTSMNALVAELVEMLHPETTGRQVQWVVTDLPTVDCDPVLVKQVFQNLLTNALKFTRPRAPAVIEVSHKEEDGQSVFMVRDNGIGFNMKYVDKLFGVFQRLHRPEDFEGTGIGLATVQRIVQKHGGRVWAEAGVDKGAAFYFTLSGATGVSPVLPGADVQLSTTTKRNAAASGGQS